jgi:hypothetical protein
VIRQKLLVLAALSLAAHAAVAQVRDSASTLVLDETFPGPRATFFLGGDLAYRVEVRGAGPDVDSWLVIRPTDNTSAPPLVLMPLSDEARGMGGYSYLVIPRQTGSYRLDVDTRDMVRIIIARDRAESTRWSRVAEPSGAGIGLRFGMLTGFPRPDGTQSGAMGADLCLATLPRGAGTMSGCVLSLQRYHRSGGASVTAIGLAPRFALTMRDNPTQVSFGTSISLGSANEDGHEQNYWLLGAGFVVEHRLLRHIGFEAEAGMLFVGATGTASSGSGSRTGTPGRLSFGLKYLR